MPCAVDRAESSESERVIFKGKFIASLVIYSWLIVAAGTPLEAQSKPTELDQKFQQQMDRTNQLLKDSDKLMEEFKKADQDQAQRAEEYQQQRRQSQQSGKLYVRLIVIGVCMVLAIANRVFNRGKR